MDSSQGNPADSDENFTDLPRSSGESADVCRTDEENADSKEKSTQDKARDLKF